MNPAQFRVVGDGLFDQVPRNRVEERLDIKSIAQWNFQQRFRAVPTASSAERPGR